MLKNDTDTMINHPTILVVDDIQENVRVLAQLFRQDYQVKIALKGQEALRIAETSPQPDIILLDIMMPDIDGYSICKQLKNNPMTADIPVVFITALDQEQDEEYALNLGAIDFITKPISPAVVRARVKNHLELKFLRDHLRGLSMLDGLTGLANRRRFDETLHSEWQRAKRNSSQLSLIMLDIDHFKNYNDSYGHLAGDDCLKAIADCLRLSFKRPQDLVARWGGEEFICLLPETSLAAAIQLAEQTRLAVAALRIEHRASPVAPVVTISLGVACQGNQNEATMLVELADQSLYDAKKNGRNRVSPAEPEADQR